MFRKLGFGLWVVSFGLLSACGHKPDLKMPEATIQPPAAADTNLGNTP